jgi:hypothetical protein
VDFDDTSNRRLKKEDLRDMVVIRCKVLASLMMVVVPRMAVKLVVMIEHNWMIDV